MNSRNKSMVLVDHHIEMNSDWLEEMNSRNEEFVILDPEYLFSKLDWTRYEDDVRVINKIYSRIFEEVVMNNKKIICFWPLDQQFGEEWFELESLCKANSFELELYKNLSFDSTNYMVHDEILNTWKKFVFFLMESLFEDMQLNEHLDEIATLSFDQETIILFKLVQEGTIRYSYTSNSNLIELPPNQVEDSSKIENHFQSYASFSEMLENLLESNDLSLFEPKFLDGSLEKTYFMLLSKELKTKNLIENWIKTYSLN